MMLTRDCPDCDGAGGGMVNHGTIYNPGQGGPYLPKERWEPCPNPKCDYGKVPDEETMAFYADQAADWAKEEPAVRALEDNRSTHVEGE